MPRISILILVFLFALSCKKNTVAGQRYAAPIVPVSPESWMQQLIERTNKPIALKDIFMPGAHDAGMYQLTTCSFGANDCNTQTQYLSFGEMLMQGIRIFDVRPRKSGNRFFTFHATDCNGLGCNGALLSTIYNDINQFLEQHKELVILELSHFCNTSVVDTALINLAQRTFGDKLYTETRTSSNLFIQKPLEDIIGSNGKGKVVLIYEGIADNTDNRANGQFSPNILPKEGQWTNSQTFAVLKTKQLNLYSSFSNSGNTLFQFNWQITMDAGASISCAISSVATSIQKNALSINKQIKPILDTLISTHQIYPGRIPNILYTDFSDSIITRQCIRISELNNP